jgi:hypothetical protein
VKYRNVSRRRQSIIKNKIDLTIVNEGVSIATSLLLSVEPSLLLLLLQQFILKLSTRLKTDV